LNLLSMGLWMEPDSLAVVGLPCPTFVWVNSGTHGRKPTQPYGNETKFDYIARANTKLFSICIFCHIFGVVILKCCGYYITPILQYYNYYRSIYIIVHVMWSHWYGVGRHLHILGPCPPFLHTRCWSPSPHTRSLLTLFFTHGQLEFLREGNVRVGTVHIVRHDKRLVRQCRRKLRRQLGKALQCFHQDAPAVQYHPS
jgi:hypothetical protein